jgi:PAS domain S-box-containing protein
MHTAQFLENASFLANVVADFLADGFAVGQRAIVIATPEHASGFLDAVAAKGLDTERLLTTGLVTVLDAQQLLSAFMVDGAPDERRFRDHVGAAIERVVTMSRGQPIRAYGEMVDILWRQNRPEAAIRVEEFWNDLAKRHPFSLLCAYAMGNFYSENDTQDFRQVCRLHDHVFPTESYSELEDPERALEFVRLQQRSAVLERELAERRKLEGALRRALTQRRRAERELTDFVECAIEGLHRAGPDGTILWANQAELDMLGYARDEYVGHGIAEFHVDPALIGDILDRLARGETVRAVDASLKCKDGSMKHVQINANALFEDGQFVHTRCFTSDVTAERAMQRADRHFHAIVTSSDDAIVSKDLSGTIQSWNRAAERMFGYSAEEAIGRSIRMIIPPDRQAEEDDILCRIRQGQTVDHFETVRRAKDGSDVHVSLSVSPILGPDNEIIGASKISRDISERRRAEAERDELLRREQAARREAERASRLKEHFLALVSHELRTPIQAVSGWVQIARTSNLPPAEMQRALGVMDRNVRAQVRLIDDLLDAARIATGKLQMSSDPVHLQSAIADAAESVRPSASAKGVELRVEMEPSPCIVLGDAARLQQVVANLLTNAVKFTPAKGRIAVSLTCEADTARMVVRDSGAGMSPELLPHIFEPFRQEEDGAGGQQGGLGLGLAIVRHLVEAQGGHVSAASPGPGLGSTFTVVLPVFQPEESV